MMKMKEKAERLINPPKDMTDRTSMTKCEAVTAVMTQTNAQDYYLSLNVSTKKKLHDGIWRMWTVFVVVLSCCYRAALTLDLFYSSGFAL